MFFGPLLAKIVPFKGLIIALAVVVLLGGTYAKGRRDSTAAHEARAVKQALLQAQKRVELQQKIDTLAETLEVTRVQREVVVKTILKEVPRYVKDAPAQCADTGLHAPGFRVLYDAAVTGRVPDPASVADAAPVSAADAAPTILENTAGCNENAAKIDAWQAYANTVKQHNQTLKGTK